MLLRMRSMRPLQTRSTRALSSQSSASSRQFFFRAANATHTSAPRIPRSVPISRIAPTVHKTYFATKTPGHLQSGVDSAEEKKLGEKVLEPHPESVSTESSVRHFLEPNTNQEQKDISEGIKQDLDTVKDTFQLTIVPKESYYLGFAGTIPYLATSASTVYLSWVINTTAPTQSTFLNNIMISQESAHSWLSVLEPVQLGYGAIIISFLGAIHWGLEYAEKTPSYNRTRFRYGMGVLASMMAWPTLLMPWNFALTSQFGAFVLLYFADAQATIRGWAPHWYSAYRFVLTAVVGVSIMISLIGRAKVDGETARLSGLGEKFHQTIGEQPYDSEWAKKEAVEIEKVKKEKEEAEKLKKREEAEKKKQENKNKKDGKTEDKKEVDDEKEKKKGENEK